MRSEVDIYQPNKVFRVPEMLNIQNYVILFKSNVFGEKCPKIYWIEVESSIMTYLWMRYLYNKKNSQKPNTPMGKGIAKFAAVSSE